MEELGLDNFTEEAIGTPVPSFDLARNTVLLTTTVAIAGLAFTASAKRKIRERANYRCESPLGGQCRGELECAHIDHNRKSPNYNDIDNGYLYCTWHHREDHRSRSLASLGLSYIGNKIALKRLNRKLRRVWHIIPD